MTDSSKPLAKPPEPSGGGSEPVSAMKPEVEIPVCIAAAMHLNIAFPRDYVIVGPVCFVSCRYQGDRPCKATLEIPHAVSLSADKSEEQRFRIFSFVTCNLKTISVESPSPVERKLDRLEVKLQVEKSTVRFKTIFKNPSIYAVGVESVCNGVPRPLLPLKCVLFCLYDKLDKKKEFRTIPITMYVGMQLQTVNAVSEKLFVVHECTPFHL